MLDTNVISELLEERPAKKVINWIKDRAEREESIYISAIAKAEIEYGINIMHDGKKKNALAQNANFFFNVRKKTCYAFNAQSAYYYAQIRVAQEKAGRNCGDRDTMTAAIAVQHKLVLATGDADFTGVETLQTVNPWNYKQKG